MLTDDPALFTTPEATKPHAILVGRAARWLRNTMGCGVVLAELNSTASDLIPDAIGWRIGAGGCGWSLYVECKTSRADFRADRLKRLHRDPDRCPGQERWYFTPPGLIRIEELPEAWGLAECAPTQVRKIHEPTRGPKRPERTAAELPYLLSALRRHQLGVDFDTESARFETIAAQQARK